MRLRRPCLPARPRLRLCWLVGWALSARQARAGLRCGFKNKDQTGTLRPAPPLVHRRGLRSMEGESTSAVLSGFVLGALSFQHLNTDSDSVS